MGFDGGAYRDMVALARHTTWLNGVTNWWSTYGLVLFAVLAVAALSRNGCSVRRASWLPVAVGAAVGLGLLLKSVIGEQRPCRVLAIGHTVAACPPLGDYAFPSDHAILAGAAAAAVWTLDRRLGVVAMVNAVLIGASRVYVGVHYPHDVVAGLAIGVLVVGLGASVLRRFAPVERPEGRAVAD